MQVTNNEMMEIVSGADDELYRAIGDCKKIICNKSLNRKDIIRIITNILESLCLTEGRVISLMNIIQGEIDREEEKDNND